MLDEKIEGALFIFEPEKTRKLYKHQLISMMENLEQNRRIMTTESCLIETEIGIYADMIGSGKTRSIIALIYKDRSNWEMENGESVYKKEKIEKVMEQ